MLRTADQQNKHALKMSFVSVPFSGHLKILSQWAKEMATNNKEMEITFVITGWNDVKISQNDANALRQAGINVIELSEENIQSSQPMTFTLPRVSALTDHVIDACQGSDYIVYDFFALEGYLAGKKLEIPAICSIPAVMGPFDPSCQLLKTGMNHNANSIKSLEEKYGIDIANKIEMVSDGFFIPSDYQNIQWSWPTFVKTDKYDENRSVKNYIFMRPENETNETEQPLITALKAKKKNKKIIYVSLGTVVTGNLWNNVPGTRQFVKNIFKNITEKFGEDPRYEVVIATGRKITDLFPANPSNFHILESVPQKEVLALADIFITHGGGNSVNEAIDTETPMVVIPFFGDQHLCADHIAKTGIGLSFSADELNKDNVIDTQSCHLERESMKDADAMAKAIEIVLQDDTFKKNTEKIKIEKPLPLRQLEKILSNDKTLNWHEGDLLYGCNDDRQKLAAITGRTDFYRLCNTTAFSRLFQDINNPDSLPRIIDQYHDVLTNETMTADELNKNTFGSYKKTLNEYQQYIASYLNKIKNFHPDRDREKYDETLWDMCLAGLRFFLYEKQKTIHFIMGKYNGQINLATRRELAWVKKHWQEEIVRKHVKFYVMNDEKLYQIDPEKTDWFNLRPTPTFADVSPVLVQRQMWNKTMQQIRAHHRHLFFNHLPQRYQDELTALNASGFSIIDLQKMPALAKKSLADGSVHIFAIQKNGKTTIVPKTANGFHISHAVTAENKPVICAGEVRLRPLCVNGKWLKVIDISNDSGHYMPDAFQLSQAVNAFEKLGYIVHRVNAIHTKIPESFNKVEEPTYPFKSLTRTREV